MLVGVTWGLVPDSLIRRKGPDIDGAVRIYALLSRYVNEKRGGVAWPGQDTLARELGWSTSKVGRSLRFLRDHGYLVVTRRGRKLTNWYQLTAPADEPQSDTSDSSPMTDHSGESDGSDSSPVTDHSAGDRSPMTDPCNRELGTTTESYARGPSLFEPKPADSEPVAPAAPSQGDGRPRGRKRDHLWDALTEAIGVDMGSLTPSARGELNGHLRTLKNLPTPATPETVRARAEDYALLHGGRLPTAKALVAEWATLERQAAAKRQADAEMDAKRASWGQRRGGRGAPPPPPQPTDDGTVMVTIEVAPPDATPVRLEDGHIPIYERVPVEVECRKDAEGDLVPVACMPPKETIESKALRAAWRRWLKAKGIPESVLGGWIYWGEANTAWVAEHYPELGEVTHVSAIGIELGLCPWTGGPPDWCGVPLTREVGKFVMARRRERVSLEWLDNARKWWHELLHSVDHLPRYATPEGPSTTERSCPMVPWGYWQRAGLKADPA